MRLIETWDVLKSNCSVNIAVVYVINRNMGCIEITFLLSTSGTWYRLIETWDVLK